MTNSQRLLKNQHKEHLRFVAGTVVLSLVLYGACMIWASSLQPKANVKTSRSTAAVAASKSSK